MEYVRLGWSRLKVSRICLGAMSFGDPALQVFRGGDGFVAEREEAVADTEVFFPMRNKPNDSGLSRKLFLANDKQAIRIAEEYSVKTRNFRNPS
ncbi:MAG: hypothetical protein QXR97_01970 [Thermoproteota archaeon]